MPAGACTSTTSPAVFPINARAIGDVIDTFFSFRSASTTPTTDDLESSQSTWLSSINSRRTAAGVSSVTFDESLYNQSNSVASALCDVDASSADQAVAPTQNTTGYRSTDIEGSG